MNIKSEKSRAEKIANEEFEDALFLQPNGKSLTHYHKYPWEETELPLFFPWQYCLITSSQGTGLFYMESCPALNGEKDQEQSVAIKDITTISENGEEKVVLNNNTTLEKIKTLIKKSSGTPITLLLLLNNLHSNNKDELCYNISLPTYDEYIGWLEIFIRREQLRIIYLLLHIGTMHPSGMAKILENGRKQQIQFLNPLINLKIVEEADRKDPDVSFIYKVRKHFRLDDYHFKQATFYRLTLLAKLFFGNVADIPYNELLDTHTISVVENWKEQLRKTHKQQPHQNICNEDEALQEIKNQWWMQKNEYGVELGTSWLKRKLEIYKERGTTFTKDPIEIINLIKEQKRGER